MSTMRYDNAGGVGAGPTTNNMASRAKAFILYNSVNATPTISGSFNVTSLGDNAVGNHSLYYGTTFNPYPIATLGGTANLTVTSTTAATLTQVMTYNTALTSVDTANVFAATHGLLL